MPLSSQRHLRAPLITKHSEEDAVVSLKEKRDIIMQALNFKKQVSITNSLSNIFL